MHYEPSLSYLPYKFQAYNLHVLASEKRNFELYGRKLGRVQPKC